MQTQPHNNEPETSEDILEVLKDLSISEQTALASYFHFTVDGVERGFRDRYGEFECTHEVWSVTTAERGSKRVTLSRHDTEEDALLDALERVCKRFLPAEITHYLEEVA